MNLLFLNSSSELAGIVKIFIYVSITYLILKGWGCNSSIS